MCAHVPWLVATLNEKHEETGPRRLKGFEATLRAVVEQRRLLRWAPGDDDDDEH